MREQLSKQKHLEHVVDLINKITDLTEEGEPAYPKDVRESFKVAAELRLKLCNKYIPDLKSTELNVSGQLDTGPVDDIKPVDWEMLRQAKQDVAKTIQ